MTPRLITDPIEIAEMTDDRESWAALWTALERETAADRHNDSDPEPDPDDDPERSFADELRDGEMP